MFLLGKTLIFIDAFQQAVAAFDGLDLVVNNAAILNDTAWEDEINTNCVSPFRINRRTHLIYNPDGRDFSKFLGNLFVNR